MTDRAFEVGRMTDAELQALELGTIVFHQHGTRIEQLIWDGKPGWFNDPVTGAMVYELHDRYDAMITNCITAADLHKTAEEAIEAIVNADKSGWPLAQKALAEVLRMYRNGLSGDWVRSIGDEFMQGLQA